MSEKIVETIDLTDSSTTLEVALAEVLSGSDEQPDKDVGSNNNGVEEEPTEQIEESNDKSVNTSNELLEGISTDTTETKPDENITDEPVERQSLFFYQIDDKTTEGSFRPEDPGDSSKRFPLKSSGQIETITVVSQSSSFNATLILDSDKIIDNKSWSYLDTLSQELSHIGAYQRSGGEYVLSISDYPFNKEIDFSLRPTDDVTFDVIRVELMIDEYTTGEK